MPIPGFTDDSSSNCRIAVMRIPPQTVGLPASALALLQARTSSGAGGASDATGPGVAAPRRIAAVPAVSGIGADVRVAPAPGRPQGDRPAPSSARLNAHAVERPLPPSSDRPPRRGSLVDILA
jgi:hypothetical protein